jgi:hypothetical protein
MIQVSFEKMLPVRSLSSRPVDSDRGTPANVYVSRALWAHHNARDVRCGESSAQRPGKTDYPCIFLLEMLRDSSALPKRSENGSPGTSRRTSEVRGAILHVSRAVPLWQATAGLRRGENLGEGESGRAAGGQCRIAPPFVTIYFRVFRRMVEGSTRRAFAALVLLPYLVRALVSS